MGRLPNGWTHGDLAQVIGVKRSTLQGWLCGAYRPRSEPHRAALEKALAELELAWPTARPRRLCGRRAPLRALCPGCGGPMASGARLCRACVHRETAAKLVCPRCGGPKKIRAQHCRPCRYAVPVGPPPPGSCPFCRTPLPGNAWRRLSFQQAWCCYRAILAAGISRPAVTVVPPPPAPHARPHDACPECGALKAVVSNRCRGCHMKAMRAALQTSKPTPIMPPARKGRPPKGGHLSTVGDEEAWKALDAKYARPVRTVYELRCLMCGRSPSQDHPQRAGERCRACGGRLFAEPVAA